MSPWLPICLIPPALIVLLWLAVKVGLWIEEWLAGVKWNLLEQHGVEVEGIILESEEYTGPGLRSDDPCFKGSYQFTDHRGKIRRGTFKNHCTDQYDILSSVIGFDELRAVYRPDSPLKIRYLRVCPLIHYTKIRRPPDENKLD